MKKLLLLAGIVFSLSANQCETAKVNYDKSYKLYISGVQAERRCNLLIKNLKIIKRDCNYSARTNVILGIIIKEQEKECRNIGV